MFIKDHFPVFIEPQWMKICWYRLNQRILELCNLIGKILPAQKSLRLLVERSWLIGFCILIGCFVVPLRVDSKLVVVAHNQQGFVGRKSKVFVERKCLERFELEWYLWGLELGFVQPEWKRWLGCSQERFLELHSCFWWNSKHFQMICCFLHRLRIQEPNRLLGWLHWSS